jgi:hypothetical protein
MPARFYLTLICWGVLVFHGFLLLNQFGTNPGWLINAAGKPVATDFIGVWSAGELALRGEPIAAYDSEAHRTELVALTGNPKGPNFQFPYPPFYLALAALLALMPYVPAAMIWIAATACLFASTAVRILERREAIVWLGAAPACVFNVYTGQNGFLSAGLIGMGLLCLRT